METKESPAYVTSKGTKAMQRYEEFMQFRYNLTLLRCADSKSQVDLAFAMNIRPKRVGDFELGRVNPTWDEIRFIAKYFNVTIDQLMYQKATVSFIEQQ